MKWSALAAGHLARSMVLGIALPRPGANGNKKERQMTIKTYAKVLKDSISPYGVRLITWEICCHRWILAEHNTHRVLSRNFRSSRAVPVKKMLEEVRSDPAMPIEWRHNQKGMVAGELMTPEEAQRAEWLWRNGAREAADRAEKLATVDLHKQWANRVLEPYLYVYGVVSTTETANLFRLRRAPDAQPEFRLLADHMWHAMQESTPTSLPMHEWHLPYVSADEMAHLENMSRCHPDDPASAGLPGDALALARDLSAARCARVSVRPFDGNDDLRSELIRARRLKENGHMSPFEHQATPDEMRYPTALFNAVQNWGNTEHWGNFFGWQQYRKMTPNEATEDR